MKRAEVTEQDVICRQAWRVKIYFEIRVLAPTNAYMRYRLIGRWSKVDNTSAGMTLAATRAFAYSFTHHWQSRS